MLSWSIWIQIKDVEYIKLSESIDTLPDIGDLAIESETESDNQSDDDEMENDSDYVPLENKKSENAAEVKDAALIAKAISSVLSGENSE